MIKTVFSALKNNCPNCGIGKVFKTSNIVFDLGFSNMEAKCQNCAYKFDNEPGFFMGAMYASYGLAIAEAFITYLFTSFFFEDTFDLKILGVIMLVLLLLSFFNYPLSRIIWLYLFGAKSK